jgi:hypothetical protein
VDRLKKNSIVVQTESGLHPVVVSTALIIPVDQQYPRSVVAPAFDLVINPLVPTHDLHSREFGAVSQIFTVPLYDLASTRTEGPAEGNVGRFIGAIRRCVDG